jgi:hypothetical protein
MVKEKSTSPSWIQYAKGTSNGMSCISTPKFYQNMVVLFFLYHGTNMLFSSGLEQRVLERACLLADDTFYLVFFVQLLIAQYTVK